MHSVRVGRNDQARVGVVTNLPASTKGLGAWHLKLNLTSTSTADGGRLDLLRCNTGKGGLGWATQLLVGLAGMPMLSVILNLASKCRFSASQSSTVVLEKLQQVLHPWTAGPINRKDGDAFPGQHPLRKPRAVASGPDNGIPFSKEKERSAPCGTDEPSCAA